MRRSIASLLALAIGISPALAQTSGTSPSKTDRVVGGGRPGAGISSESNRDTTTGSKPSMAGQQGAAASKSGAPDAGATSATAASSK